MINDARKCYITYHANAHEQLHKAHIYIYINIQNLYWIMCNELLNRIMIMSTFTKT